jgi:hypothetical protein
MDRVEGCQPLWPRKTGTFGQKLKFPFSFSALLDPPGLASLAPHGAKTQTHTTYAYRLKLRPETHHPMRTFTVHIIYGDSNRAWGVPDLFDLLKHDQFPHSASCPPAHESVVLGHPPQLARGRAAAGLNQLPLFQSKQNRTPFCQTARQTQTCPLKLMSVFSSPTGTSMNHPLTTVGPQQGTTP